MNDLNVLIEQMAANISSEAMGLDELRLNLFLRWLNRHSSRLTRTLQSAQMDAVSIRKEMTEERLKSGLRMWLESLSMQGMLWEYCLILNEIAWCRGLDARRLIMILKSEAGK